MMVGKRNVNETKGRSIRWGAVLVGVALASLSPSTAFAEDVIPNPGADLDPPSQWLVRRNLSIPANPISNASFDASLIPVNIAGVNGRLDNIVGCEMENITNNWHPFVTDTIDVVVGGVFTFRIVASPGVDDPFLALYEGSFDPDDPNAGVIGCNDDGVEGDVFDENPWDPTYEYGPNDDDEYWSQFETELDPGTYTILLATYDDYSINDYWYEDNGDDPGSAALEEVSSSAFSGEATAVFEYWGPEGGIALQSEGGRPSLDKDAYFDWQNGRAGELPGSELPNTGGSSNGVSALIALGLLGVGSTLLSVSRRRGLS